MFDAVQRCAKKKVSSCTHLLHRTTQLMLNVPQIKIVIFRKIALLGIAKDCNGLINPQNYSFQSSDTVTYYQFQSMPTGKLNKNGKPKYKTKRTNYNCVPAEECKQKLDGVSKNYLLHRFDGINDKMFWPLIMEACKKIGDVIVHMDYSENLKEKPKLEVQSLFWGTT